MQEGTASVEPSRATAPEPPVDRAGTPRPCDPSRKRESATPDGGRIVA